MNTEWKMKEISANKKLIYNRNQSYIHIRIHTMQVVYIDGKGFLTKIWILHNFYK